MLLININLQWTVVWSIKLFSSSKLLNTTKQWYEKYSFMNLTNSIYCIGLHFEDNS